MSEFDGEIDSILEGMTDYVQICLDEGEPEPYAAHHVEKCGAILRNFVDQVEKVANPAEVEPLVKQTVQALNDLNKAAGGSLIETDQREEIVPLIIEIAAQAGYVSKDPRNEDITEVWRDW